MRFCSRFAPRPHCFWRLLFFSQLKWENLTNFVSVWFSAGVFLFFCHRLPRELLPNGRRIWCSDNAQLHGSSGRMLKAWTLSDGDRIFSGHVDRPHGVSSKLTRPECRRCRWVNERFNPCLSEYPCCIMLWGKASKVRYANTDLFRLQQSWDFVTEDHWKPVWHRNQVRNSGISCRNGKKTPN